MFLQALAWARLSRRHRREKRTTKDGAPPDNAPFLDLVRLEDRILYSVTPVGTAPAEALCSGEPANFAMAHGDSQWNSTLVVEPPIAPLQGPDGVDIASPDEVGFPSDAGAMKGPAEPGDQISTEALDNLSTPYELLTGPHDTDDSFVPETLHGDRLELVFIDSQVENYEQLLDNLFNASTDGRRLEVVMLDPSRDGIEQISDSLAQHEGVNAVHVMAHGDEHALELGNTRLDALNLDAHSGALVAWRDALAPGAELVLHDCNAAAASLDGQTLIEGIGVLTGAEVEIFDGARDDVHVDELNNDIHTPPLPTLDAQYAHSLRSADGDSPDILDADRLVDNSILSLAARDRAPGAAVFDIASGQLAIYGDASDNVVRQWITEDGFLEIDIDGEVKSSRPESVWYDAALFGATSNTLTEVLLFGGDGSDQLLLGNHMLEGDLVVHSDDALVIEGSIHVGASFLATSDASIELAGCITAHSGYVSLHSTTETLLRGSIDVSGTPGGVGGRVEVLGPVVALLDSAVINASGDAGGGRVLIGGDLQGRNPDIPTAQYALVTAGSRIHSDALVEGDGGTVVVWSDLNTHYYGEATARGGSVAGDGGLVEVSGKENLTFRGNADLSAEYGSLGTLLLDPTDIVIASGTADSAADGTNTFRGAPSNVIGQILSADTGPTTIYESELQGLSNSTHIILQATNNITINDLSDNTLTLAARTGSLTIHADFDGDGAGSFSMNSGDTIRTSGGNVSIRGATVTVGLINTTGAASFDGGDITLTADVGAVTVASTLNATGGTNRDGGDVAIVAAGSVTVGATLTATAGAYSASNPGKNAGAVSITGSTISVAAIDALGRTATTAGFAGGSGGAVNLNATSGGITLGGNIMTTGGNGSGGGAGGNAGNITLHDPVTLTGNRTLSAVGGTGGTAGPGGNIQLTSTVNSNGTARNLTLTAGSGDVTVGGTIGGTSALAALTVTGNDISLSNIGGGAAGVNGATSVTASTSGGDVGSISFTGTTYNANAQTYTTPSGSNLLLNAGALTTFTSSADAVSFTTGTLLLSDASNLSVTTAGGTISALGGIRGTSFESVTLNSGGTTQSLGAIGSGDEISSVSITATTATLSGDIITGDTAGNNVTITGAVTLNNAVGTTLTIDAANATNDGAINISGTITGTARNLMLLGGAISTATITTTGGSNQDGGSVTVTGSGAVIATGAITTSAGTYLASNPGKNAGAVSITGSTTSVAAIDALGRTATTAGFAGGSGGAVNLNATSGGITLGGNIMTTGGNGSGGGAGGNAGNITLSDPVTLTGNRTLSAVGGTGGTAGAGGNIQLTSTVNSDGTARNLTLTAGSGDVTVGGTIGGTSALAALTVTGNDISLSNIGGGAAGVNGATSVTASTSGGDVGSISFTGTTYNANAQTYTTPSGSNLLLNAGALTTFTSSADAVSFTTGTLLLSDASNLSVTTAGGTISALGGIRGTSFESVTLNSGGTTQSLGAIGSGDEISSVSITATTTTLSGDIITGDTAGNNVTITGAVTLNNAVGTTLTIDAANATNDGAINISGTITGTARNLMLLGGAISTATITATGGSNQDGGSVTVTGSGAVIATGAITTSAGTYLASNPGKNAGAVSITGSTTSVAAIDALGRTATTAGFAGGSGGAVNLNATSGGITLGGNIMTTGGNGSGGGAGGNAGNITLSDPVTLTGNRTLSAVGGTGGTAGAGGNIQLTSTVNSDGTARNLTLTAGSGDVTVGGTIGGTSALAALTVTGNDISLSNIGGGAAGVNGATSVTANDNGGDTGAIQLNGAVHAATTRLTAGSGGIALDGTVNVGANNLTLDSDGTVSQSAAISAAGLELLGIATFNLTQSANDVNTLAANIDGALSYIDADDLVVGTVAATIGIRTGNPAAGGAVTIAVLGDLTVDATINTSTGSGGALTVYGGVTLNATPVLGAGNILLVASNHAPVNTAPGPQSTSEDTNLVFSSGNGNPISIGDTDAYGNAIQVTLTATNGTLTLSQITGLSFTAGDGTGDAAMTFSGSVSNINAALNGLTFAPTSNYNGSASLQIVTDDLGNTGIGGAQTDTDTVNITVNAVNDTPTGADITVVTAEDTAYTLAAADFGFSDVDTGDTLSAVRIDSLPAAGSLTLSGAAVTAGQVISLINLTAGNLVFTPTANANGSPNASFTFSVRDSAGGYDVAPNTLTLNVTPVNDSPSGADSTIVMVEDTAYTLAAADFGFIDIDSGDILTAIRIDGLPAAGSLTLAGAAVSIGQVIAAADIAAGRLVFAPAAHGNGSPYSSFTFSVRDSASAYDNAPNTLSLRVMPVDDMPIANPDSFTTNEDAPLSVAAAGVLGNDVEFDGDVLTADVITGPSHGTLSLNSNGSFTYAPHANFNGTDSFVYRAGDGTTDVTATVTIAVQAVNDAPIASPEHYFAQNDAVLSAVESGVLINDYDIDSSAIHAVLVSGPDHGELVLNPDGSFIYTPDIGFQGTVSFTYQAADGTDNSAVTTVNISIRGVIGPRENRWMLAAAEDAGGGTEEMARRYTSDKESAPIRTDERQALVPNNSGHATKEWRFENRLQRGDRGPAPADNHATVPLPLAISASAIGDSVLAADFRAIDTAKPAADREFDDLAEKPIEPPSEFVESEPAIALRDDHLDERHTTWFKKAANVAATAVAGCLSVGYALWILRRGGGHPAESKRFRYFKT